MQPQFKLSHLALALTLSLGAIPTAQAQSATETELMRRLDQLAAELNKVRNELTQLQQQQQLAQRPAEAAKPAAVATFIEAEPSQEPKTVVGGYAELNYNRPRHHSQDTQADLRRLVLSVQHRFDERTKIVTELELEHGVSSAGDPGEVAVEQAYVEHQLTPSWAVRGGLFLMPLGLLNENHEPPAFFGVERNFVETAIIPTTWREGGFQLVGNLDHGMTVQGGISTSFDINKWDANASEGRESPLGSIHQEMAQAKAHDLALFGAVNWRGIPGLQVGAGFFSGQASHKQAAADSRVTLWDLHTRWTPGRWDLSALYARGSISNTALLNQPLVGQPTLIPKSFEGWYAQAGYKLWEQASYALLPFVRWEQFNTASGFADLGQGLTPSAQPNERVITVGANFRIAQGVVLKADMQRFGENKDGDRFNLGLGWSF
ncbi:hypothetical protein [Roseateles albus]|uniref:Porin n=1 Tax=Roseateles albus TaxID=2987525 RepID=A0ABT5KHT0_9BURK|nr:hypothetical protein [Roseateles albus]MDC8773468.1 hypothetical protein [Roseateles albus]